MPSCQRHQANLRATQQKGSNQAGEGARRTARPSSPTKSQTLAQRLVQSELRVSRAFSWRWRGLMRMGTAL